MTEIYKDIPGYEGLYQVSNLGNVYGVKRKHQIAKNDNGNGYLYVRLSKNGKVKNHYIHRLVAIAFIPNPTNLPEVNHKDENKQNNTVENLEWCDDIYNTNYGTARERMIKAQSKPVNQYKLNGDFIKSWNSIAKIESALGFSRGNISKCCSGKYKTAYSYKWRYANKEFNLLEEK